MPSFVMTNLQDATEGTFDEITRNKMIVIGTKLNRLYGVGRNIHFFIPSFPCRLVDNQMQTLS